MTGSLRIGLIGPDQTQPCGISDYTARLALALSQKCELVFVPYGSALSDKTSALGHKTPSENALSKCQALLVQYERSLVPEKDFLLQLSKKFPGRVFVVPHEVYADDPFAYPYHAIWSSFPPLLALKRFVYHWRHREYAQEKSLQRRAYEAHGVIPLSGPGFDILKPLAGNKILNPVPLAFFTPLSPDLATPIAAGQAPTRESLFPEGTTTVLGIFGFLNPGLDYSMVFDLLEKLKPGVCLMIVGGPRPGTEEIFNPKIEAAKRGLSKRVHITGYLPEEKLFAHLRLCDLFICPMRFKSNSSSLLNLIHLGKPLLASDLPLTRYLKAEGVPVELYGDLMELTNLVKRVVEGGMGVKPNRYIWDFNASAEAYLRVLAAQIRS